MRPFRILLPAAIALLCVRPAPAETLRVFAAASLTEAFREIGGAYEKSHPGDRVEFNFAGSQVLRTQIEQGAPADVFASADGAMMAPLQRRGRVGRPTLFAHNRLGVVVPARNGRVRRLADLARSGVKVVVAGPTVPVGRYTLEAVAKMNAFGRFGRGFQARLLGNVVSRETNVRMVLSKVALGEADAGFVYLTDAATTPAKVRTLALPERMNVVAAYPIAVVTQSPAKKKAGEFVRLVLGRRGKAILRKHGFQG